MKVYCILANEDIFYEKDQVREREQMTAYLAPGRFLLRFYEKKRALRLDFNSEMIDGYVSAIVADKKKLENMVGAGGVFPLSIDEDIAQPFLNLAGESSRTGKLIPEGSQNLAVVKSFFMYLFKKTKEELDKQSE